MTGLRPALDTLSRTLAAGLGGYALAQALPVTLVALAPWPLDRADAVLVAMQLSFAVYALAFMAAFAVRSAGRAWAAMAVCLCASASLAWTAL